MSDGKPRIIKSIPLLQAKVGAGDVDAEKIEKSQRIIEKNQTDFVPMALDLLNDLESAIKDVRKSPSITSREPLELMTIPVMQIKANAAMFGYNLVTTLANVVLNFLEALETVNEDVIDIVDAHHKTLKHIMTSGMKGDGGEKGEELTKELKDAIKRYFAKYPDASG